MTQSAPEISKLIDHTLLRPEATYADFEKHFAEAREHGFFSVCIPPMMVTEAKRVLRPSTVLVCTVIGFPFGYNTQEEKVFAIQRALQMGADEVDVVMNVTAAKSGDWKVVADDIRAMVLAASGRVLKVILETGLLTDAEKMRAAQTAELAGASFVKTCTGFGPAGVTVSDVQLLKDCLSKKTQIKASGGIRDKDTLLALVRAGATRIGTNSGVGIVTGTESVGSY